MWKMSAVAVIVLATVLMGSCTAGPLGGTCSRSPPSGRLVSQCIIPSSGVADLDADSFAGLWYLTRSSTNSRIQSLPESWAEYTESVSAQEENGIAYLDIDRTVSNETDCLDEYSERCMLDSGMCTYSANMFIGIRRFILATDYNTTAVVLWGPTMLGISSLYTAQLHVLVRDPASTPNADIVAQAVGAICNDPNDCFKDTDSDYWLQIPNNSTADCS